MPRQRSTLYTLTKADRAIFERTEEDPNAFTNWYFRGPQTGTWARYDDGDERYQKLHHALLKRWNALDRPKTFDWAYSLDEVPLVDFVTLDGDIVPRGLCIPTIPSPVNVSFKLTSRMPAFHIVHGFWLQEFQVEFLKAKQEARVLVGGFGSSKTIISIIDILIKCATLPGFRAFALAFFGVQVTEIYKKANDLMRGTLFEERFLIGSTSKQPEVLKIGNDECGENLINFFSIHDSPDKILNLEGDMAMVDQTEQLPNIQIVRANLSTRLRGFYQSRERLGIVNYVANPNDNPDLWALADDGEDNPDNVLFKQISSYDNWALTEKQLRRYERDLPKDKATRLSKLYGYRPVGDGKIFSASMVQACLSSELDERMEQGLLHKLPGYAKIELPRIGIQRWELPYEGGHEYVVIADPGFDSPPNRNAAAIGVWDTTMFPEAPARMAAFHWVNGNNSPEPWMSSYYEYVLRYNAVGRNAYDNTGWQSGYQRWVDLFKQVNSQPMSFTGANKFSHINAAKVMMARGGVLFPTIQAMISQFAKYDYDDDKLVQDVIAMFMMSCSYLNQLFFMQRRDDKTDTVPAPQERYAWKKGSRKRHAYYNH